MTVASAVARSGPYAGNGSQTVFAYTFKVFAASELQVVLRSAGGVETVQTLTTHYTVSGVGNDAGGNVTMVTAPPTGATLTIVRNVPFVQLTDLRNQGGFYPEVHERVFDRIVMQTQQLAEEVGRSVKLSVASPIDPDVFNQSINTLAENVDDVNVVAANMTDVQAVAAIDADVQVAAANVADITNFADVYQGAKATDPTLRNDTTALQAGDLYFNTASAKMRAYSGSVWVDAGTPIPLSITTQQFSGTGSQTVFTLSSAPAFPAALDVFISGVSQKLTADYTVSGTTLTFVAAPPAGTNNIYVKILSAYAGGVPNDGSVTPAKMAFNFYQQIQRQTVSGVSAVDFTLPSGFRRFELKIDRGRVAFAAQLALRCGVGATFDAGASDYIWSAIVQTGPSVSATPDTNDNSINISGGIVANDTRCFIHIDIDPGGAGEAFTATIRAGVRENATPAFRNALFHGVRNAAGAKDAIRIVATGGINISGTFTLLGIPA